MFAMPRHMSFNGRNLDAPRVAAIRARVPDLRTGAYWYDARSGLWGAVGEGPSGRFAAGLPLGRMHPRCSRQDGAGTGVFLNGREVTQHELEHLRHVGGMMPPGRYILEADGHMRPETGAAHIWAETSHAA